MKIKKGFLIKEIRIVKGIRVEYDYEFDRSIKKYFNNKERFFVEYDDDISDVPISVLVIPLLANVLPISWFAGFDISLNELDDDFYFSLISIKSEFVQKYPEMENKISNLNYNKLVKNKVEEENAAMLFSGGVDSYATYFRHLDENLDLVTIHGADIKIDDTLQWQKVVSLNSEERLLKGNVKHYIKSNIRNFYTYHVDTLLNNLGWWGRVQHGLALSCLLAPLSIKKCYYKIYIASTHTYNFSFAWGSSPLIDNKIRWANVQVVHDGYELKRQDKVKLIVNNAIETNEKIKLRVCYSDLNKTINCSKCEKCYRTIFNIILSGDNPNNYGFKTSEKVYDDVLDLFKDGFSEEDTEYFWWEINEKIKSNSNYYIFNDKENEVRKMQLVSELIATNISSGLKETSKWRIIKFKIINSFPKLFNFYLSIRQKKI